MKNYDILCDFGSGRVSWGPTDEKISKELLISIMMKKYDISNSDLDDINVVKSKLRDINIDEIIK